MLWFTWSAWFSHPKKKPKEFSTSGAVSSEQEAITRCIELRGTIEGKGWYMMEGTEAFTINEV